MSLFVIVSGHECQTTSFEVATMEIVSGSDPTMLASVSISNDVIDSKCAKLQKYLRLVQCKLSYFRLVHPFCKKTFDNRFGSLDFLFTANQFQ